MKQNVLKVIGTGIANGSKQLLEAGKKHSGLIFLGLNLVSTGVLVYEVWTRKEKIEKAIEETKDAPITERLKKIGKEAWPIAVAGAVSTGSAIGGTIVAAKTAKKLTDTATKLAEAKDSYQEATKQVVGEEKEKEIRTKAAEVEKEKTTEALISKSNVAGSDVYYDETNPGFVFYFNDDKRKNLETLINQSTKYAGEQVSLDTVYNWIEDMSDNALLERASFSDEIGWKSGTRVYVKSKYIGMRDGRGLFKIAYEPAPVSLGQSELSD